MICLLLLQEYLAEGFLVTEQASVEVAQRDWDIISSQPGLDAAEELLPLLL